MGLSIHYHGRIKHPDSLPAMIEEVKDIAEVSGWTYYIYEGHFPENAFEKEAYDENIYGISLSIPDCEPIWFCFLSNGKMSNPLLLRLFGKSAPRPEHPYLYLLSSKTQFAGVRVHQFVIQLFKHLNKKYFLDFEMMDEGGYWESGNIKILEAGFKKYQDLFDSISTAMDNHQIRKDESVENYFERLLKQIQIQKNKNGSTN